MAAPIGNQYAAKEHKWKGAIERALIRNDGSLNRIADKVVAKAEEGESWAINMIGDRLDGKPKQVIDHGLSDEPDNPIQSLVQAADEIKAKIRSSAP